MDVIDPCIARESRKCVPCNALAFRMVQRKLHRKVLQMYVGTFRRRGGLISHNSAADSRMASDNAEIVALSLQLLDFDWKLKYAVSSAALIAVNRPLLRLELAVTTSPVTVENVPYFRKESFEEKPLVAVGEYSESELDTLISEMEAISQALDSMESSE